MRTRIVPTLITSLLMGANSACAQTVELEQSTADRIEVSRLAMFPEDVKYNIKTGKFVVGSFREGAVYEINNEGAASLLVADDNLISALGVALDIGRNRLYVATANVGASLKASDNIRRLAGLGIYNLETGQAIDFIDLGALLPEMAHLANGITLDDNGNVYVTDSLAPVIYKVTPDGVPSIFLRSAEFEGEGISLNGIAYHPNGYFILAKKSEGRLFKVPADNPREFTEIELPERLLGVDGVLVVDEREIVVVANTASGVSTNAAFSIDSDDEWKSGKITGKYQFGDVYPTASVVKNGEIYGLYSKNGELVAAPADKKASLQVKAILQKIGHLRKR